MDDLNIAATPGRYDTAINIIGGLRDCNVIFKAIESHFNQSDSAVRRRGLTVTSLFINGAGTS